MAFLSNLEISKFWKIASFNLENLEIQIFDIFGSPIGGDFLKQMVSHISPPLILIIAGM